MIEAARVPRPCSRLARDLRCVHLVQGMIQGKHRRVQQLGAVESALQKTYSALHVKSDMNVRLAGVGDSDGPIIVAVSQRGDFEWNLDVCKASSIDKEAVAAKCSW